MQKPTNDEEAKEMLDYLKEYYREPVLPMSEYCKVMRTWAACIESLNSTPPEDDWDGRQGKEYHNVISQILIDIDKSALLWRLLYKNEDLRDTKCPLHDGHWHGPTWIGMQECEYGCEGTGWLKEDPCELCGGSGDDWGEDCVGCDGSGYE